MDSEEHSTAPGASVEDQSAHATAATIPSPQPGPFRKPTRGIFNQADLRAFHKSQTYADFLSFIRLCSDRVRGVAVSDSFPVSQAVEKLIGGLEAMYTWVDEIPPLQQPMRFGNRAFRTWHARLVERAPDLIRSLLPESLSGNPAVVDELLPYLASGFGHETRIDYGTGHETSFVVFLYCLFKLQVITPDDLPAVVLRVFGTSYLKTMRRLQTEYMLEPAGSHGVWGLDDYHCLVFLWGSSQLLGHPSITPASIHNEQIRTQQSGDYMYLAAISFIQELKQGVPFAESSPMLNDISNLPSWHKVNVGMLRLYEGEVLGKLPVIQHLVFGSLFTQSWTSSGSAADQGTEPKPHTGIENTVAPWAPARKDGEGGRTSPTIGER